MPFIRLTISGQEDQGLAAACAKKISQLTQDLLNKNPGVTAITVDFMPDHLWFVNSCSLAELQKKSFHLVIKVSDSTNLKPEKAAYIEAVHVALEALLGNLHPVSYTAIEEMKADAYGYSGSTIEFKLISNKIMHDLGNNPNQ